MSVVGVTAGVAAVLGQQTSKSSALSPSAESSSPLAVAPSNTPRGGLGGAVGETDGVAPDGVAVFDDAYPAVAKLDPDLLKALCQAATDAVNSGVTFYVNSSCRSPEYQNDLLREAVARGHRDDVSSRVG